MAKFDFIIDGDNGANNLFGFATRDQLNGFDGDDTLNGADGNDQLNGGAGNDVLDGYDGRDALYGGPGDDTFYFGWMTFSPDHGGARDLIGDLEAGDFIDFSGMRSDPAVAIDFESQVAIQDQAGDKSRVLFDYDSDGVYDLGVDVVGVTPTEAMFIL